ncbi:MAG: NADH:flavin oxidoreductase/NADH Oxidase [Moraxellaceae bacterium]|jgi:2,4-dienoyl-CoA reductase-like NADH-dependent reductase (Old Yellow Enzyme family)|nr:NADH:flavin oxidoreductase/NADH Oxidase [Moraxellaceae bacterium]
MTQSLSPAQVLAQPYTLPNGAVVKNRLVKSAMSESLATYDNHVTPELVRLYGRWAAGGTGLLITGNVMIDRRALGEPGNVVLEDERDMELLRAWARAGTQNGTQLWMQINHPGKQVMRSLNTDAVAPSAIPFEAPELAAVFLKPRALTEAEILDLIQRFGRTAELAKQAGFSGVQIHGAHGYLVSQFLSGRHNQRTDQWGGSAENRRRFVLAVYAEMRRRCGPDFPIAIKLNSADFQKGGFTEEESLDVIRALGAAGIDQIEISGGTYEAPAMAGKKQAPLKDSTRRREAYFMDFAAKARAAVKTPLMVTGGFRSLAGMAEAIQSGDVDFVGLARGLAIEPDLSSRLLAGKEPRFQVKPISTGIRMVDDMGMMEVMWYSRQLHRMGRGKAPRPNESGLISLVCTLAANGWGTFQTRRLRA